MTKKQFQEMSEYLDNNPSLSDKYQDGHLLVSQSLDNKNPDSATKLPAPALATLGDFFPTDKTITK